MSIHSHARCDQCEKPLIPLGDESVSEDYVLDSGWIVVHWVEGDEDERVDVSKDFCTFGCASNWIANEVAGQTERKTDDRAGT
jgi:hypothetical protein